MTTVMLGNVELGSIPGVVAVIDRLRPVAAIGELPGKGATILEIRVDCISEPFSAVVEYARELRTTVNIPLIGTIRETEHIGDNRLSLFTQLMPVIDAVDIEIDADITREVISLAHEKTVIVSEHDYEETPDEKKLEKTVLTATSLGADIVKIAVMAHNREDVTRLLMFTQSRSENLVTIAMGEVGAISRIAAPLFGSLFTYAYITDAVAPGQLSLEETVAELKRFYPGFQR
jgi:3-dehydroquinate dehydratase-1